MFFLHCTDLLSPLDLEKFEIIPLYTCTSGFTDCFNKMTTYFETIISELFINYIRLKLLGEKRTILIKKVYMLVTLRAVNF